MAILILLQAFINRGYLFVLAGFPQFKHVKFLFQLDLVAEEQKFGHLLCIDHIFHFIHGLVCVFHFYENFLLGLHQSFEKLFEVFVVRSNLLAFGLQTGLLLLIEVQPFKTLLILFDTFRVFAASNKSRQIVAHWFSFSNPGELFACHGVEAEHFMLI